MAITILGPFSGLPVKVREQDVGRALRDEQGRIFYVLSRAGGEGYYASTTRAGGAAEEQRYRELESRAPSPGAPDAPAVATPSGDGDDPGVYDRTGPGRKGAPGRLVLIGMALAVLVVIGASVWLRLSTRRQPPAPPATQPAGQESK